MSKSPKNTKYSAQKPDTLVVRFPEGLKDQIMSQAKDANRSANSQIIHLLQLAISEITQGVDTKTSELSGQKLDADVDSRLVALEMAQAASFLISNSAFVNNCTNGGMMLLSTTA